MAQSEKINKQVLILRKPIVGPSEQLFSKQAATQLPKLN